MIKQYLVPVRSSIDNTFAFMLIIPVPNRIEARAKSKAIEKQELSSKLYIDTSHSFKEY